MSKRIERHAKNIKGVLNIPKVNRIYKTQLIQGKCLKLIMAACNFCIFLSVYIFMMSMMRHSWSTGRE